MVLNVPRSRLMMYLLIPANICIDLSIRAGLSTFSLELVLFGICFLFLRQPNR